MVVGAFFTITSDIDGQTSINRTFDDNESTTIYVNLPKLKPLVFANFSVIGWIFPNPQDFNYSFEHDDDNGWYLGHGDFLDNFSSQGFNSVGKEKAPTNSGFGNEILSIVVNLSEVSSILWDYNQSCGGTDCTKLRSCTPSGGSCIDLYQLDNDTELDAFVNFTTESTRDMRKIKFSSSTCFGECAGEYAQYIYIDNIRFIDNRTKGDVVNISIDAGDLDGVDEFNFTGLFNHTNSTGNINESFNFYLENCEPELNYCSVPIVLSQKGNLGLVELTNLLFNYSNNAPNITIYSPNDTFSGKTDNFVKINFSADDPDLDNLNITLYLSTSLSTLNNSQIVNFSNQSSGKLQLPQSSSHLNGTTLFYKLQVLDHYGGAFNTTLRNFTINTLSRAEATEFNQQQPTFTINGSGNWEVEYVFQMGWVTAGQKTEYNQSYNKTLIGKNPNNVSVRVIDTDENIDFDFHDGLNVTFISNNISKLCDNNIYEIRFNTTAIETTPFGFNCDDTNFDGSCRIEMNFTKHVKDYQVRFISVDILAKNLPRWGDRKSIDLDWKNTSAQTTNTATGTAYCTDAGDLGVTAEGEPNSPLGDNITLPSDPDGNETDFGFAFTGEDDVPVTINPTIKSNESGIFITGLNVGSNASLIVSYSWSAGITGTTGVPPAGGGGGGIIEIIANFSITPKAIDIPFIKLPFFGQDVAEVTLKPSASATECLFEETNIELSCVVNKETGIVKVIYSPTKDLFSDKVDNVLIIKSGQAQNFVPVTFRLINIEWVLDRLKEPKVFLPISILIFLLIFAGRKKRKI